jgi:NAD+ synthase
MLSPRPPAHAEATIQQFLRGTLAESGAAGFVVGLSGGVDSALTLRLARDAVGPDRVVGLLLPDEQHPTELRAETEAYASALGVTTRSVPIAGPEAALRALFPGPHDATTWGNMKARLRMTVLYAVAREERRLVLGTGNKSELLLGYFTKYGDGGVDLLPIGDLYKTEVWELARQLGLPAAIVERPPTAGLWEGQTDEAELGLPYRHIDRILRGIEELLEPAEIAERTGLALAAVVAIEQRVRLNRHKRRSPPIPKLSLRTIGLDWKD